MNISKTEIFEFIQTVNNDFPIRLSDKQDLYELSNKIYNVSNVFFIKENGQIEGLICGYISSSFDERAYLSILAVKKEYRNKGIAKRLVEMFIQKCIEVNKTLIYGFTHKTNVNAIKLYKKFGFIITEQSERPNDYLLVKELM